MIDLQLHTTDSDGTWAWDRVLEACRSMGLKAYAITDHDTAIRRDAIRAWATAHGEQAFPGIELSTSEKGQTVHLLGYFLDGPLERLQSRLAFLHEGRRSRNGRIIARLRQLGIDIRDEEVKSGVDGGTVGRPHIARVLLEKGVVSSIQQAFDRYLSSSGSAYFPKEELPLREGIELLRGAGAVTSVAHPGLLKRSAADLEASLKEWREWGLDGIEAVYPMYSGEQTAFFFRMAEKYGFLRTGGTDFHGENKPKIKIGVGTGAFSVPDELLEPLLQRRASLQRELGVARG